MLTIQSPRYAKATHRWRYVFAHITEFKTSVVENVFCVNEKTVSTNLSLN